jgi:EAL domain-containing protein (putative c-di-GMP-specific phosphodiesterase class I)
VLDDRAINVVFQPIVHLDSREVVGFEALARGPAGSALASPAALFAEAHREGCVDELDWVCRAAAVRDFHAASLPETTALFTNIEAVSLGSACPDDLVPVFTSAAARRHVFMELTERAVAADPAGLLWSVERVRYGSTGIALDDVGADPTSLAMMPLIRPDVIKLDLTVIQGRTTQSTARIVNAVLAEAERTGATILAEGIESERHVSVARSMGATLGQGWHYGAPGALPNELPTPQHIVDQLAPPGPDAGTPFEVVEQRHLSRGTRRLLLPMSTHLELKCLDAAEPMVVLACFQNVRSFNDRARRLYTELADRGVFTAVLGRDMPPDPGPGIRGARLDPTDPLLGQWSLVVLGPHFAAALLAKERDEPELETTFDFVVTYDRDLVIAAARPLLKRVLSDGT